MSSTLTNVLRPGLRRGLIEIEPVRSGPPSASSVDPSASSTVNAALVGLILALTAISLLLVGTLYWCGHNVMYPGRIGRRVRRASIYSMTQGRSSIVQPDVSSFFAPLPPASLRRFGDSRQDAHVDDRGDSLESAQRNGDFVKRAIIARHNINNHGVTLLGLTRETSSWLGTNPSQRGSIPPSYVSHAGPCDPRFAELEPSSDIAGNDPVPIYEPQLQPAYPPSTHTQGRRVRSNHRPHRSEPITPSKQASRPSRLDSLTEEVRPKDSASQFGSGSSSTLPVTQAIHARTHSAPSVPLPYRRDTIVGSPQESSTPVRDPTLASPGGHLMASSSIQANDSIRLERACEELSPTPATAMRKTGRGTKVPQSTWQSAPSVSTKTDSSVTLVSMGQGHNPHFPLRIQDPSVPDHVSLSQDVLSSRIRASDNSITNARQQLRARTTDLAVSEEDNIRLNDDVDSSVVFERPSTPRSPDAFLRSPLDAMPEHSHQAQTSLSATALAASMNEDRMDNVVIAPIVDADTSTSSQSLSTMQSDGGVPAASSLSLALTTSTIDAATGNSSRNHIEVTHQHDLSSTRHSHGRESR